MEEQVEMLKRDPNAEVPAVDLKLLLTPTELAKKKTSWIEDHVQTASQLSTKPVRWAIKDLLLHGGTTVIAAEAGSVKSTVSLLMVKSLLTNTPFAHREAYGEPLRVVYVDAENPEPVVRERLTAIGLLDADGKEIPGFKIWGGWVMDENLAVPRVMDDARLLEDAYRYPNTYYMFDSLSSFCNGDDENDNPAMAIHMREAKKLARMSAGVLILHHTPKDARTKWRGAMSIIDQSDHSLFFEKDSVTGGQVTIDVSDIRVRACQKWSAKWRVVFEPMMPDGRIGLHIRYDVLRSGVKGDKTPADELGSGQLIDVDFTPTEEQLLVKAAAFVKSAWDAGNDALNQSKLAGMLGIAKGREQTRLLCAVGREKYWQCMDGGTRGSLLFYPPGVPVPTQDELVEAKLRKNAERSKRARDAKKAEAPDTEPVAESKPKGRKKREAKVMETAGVG